MEMGAQVQNTSDPEVGCGNREMENEGRRSAPPSPQRSSGEQGPPGAAFARKSRVTLVRSLFSLSPSCPICQVGMKRPALTGLQRTVQIRTSFERLKGAINILLGGTLHGSETTMLWAISWLQLASCKETPSPLLQSRADSRAPAPPTNHSHSSLSAGLPTQGLGEGRERRHAGLGVGTESDLPAPVSASPPAPPPSAPGCRLEPECPTRGRPWAPRAPRTWAALRYDPAWPPRAWSPPASEQRPRPGRARHRARASPCPPPQRGAAGECPPKLRPPRVKGRAGAEGRSLRDQVGEWWG